MAVTFVNNSKESVSFIINCLNILEDSVQDAEANLTKTLKQCEIILRRFEYKGITFGRKPGFIDIILKNLTELKTSVKDEKDRIGTSYDIRKYQFFYQSCWNKLMSIKADTLTLSNEINIAEKKAKAIEIVKKIREKYNVHVSIVQTDKEYYSLDYIKRTLAEERYFISEENPEETSRCTTYLLDQKQITHEINQKKYQGFIDRANKNRFKHVDIKNRELGDLISEIQRDYSNEHNGKKPPLTKIAEILNERNVQTPREGGKWVATQVKRILEKPETQRYVS